MHQYKNQPRCSSYQQKGATFDAANQFAPMNYDCPVNNKVIRDNSCQLVSRQQPTLYDQNVDVQHQMQGFNGPQFQQLDFNGCFYNSNLLQPHHQQFNNGLFSLLINKNKIKFIFN